MSAESATERPIQREDITAVRNAERKTAHFLAKFYGFDTSASYPEPMHYSGTLAATLMRGTYPEIYGGNEDDSILEFIKEYNKMPDVGSHVLKAAEVIAIQESLKEIRRLEEQKVHQLIHGAKKRQNF